jgi:hypothetical protein
MKKYFIITLFKTILLLNTSSIFAQNSPQDVYESYLYAIETHNIDGLIKYIDPSKEVNRTELALVIDKIAMEVPQNITFHKEIIIDDVALLYPKGNFHNPITGNYETCSGVVKLFRTQKLWKVAHNYWKCKK